MTNSAHGTVFARIAQQRIGEIGPTGQRAAGHVDTAADRGGVDQGQLFLGLLRRKQIGFDAKGFGLAFQPL